MPPARKRRLLLAAATVLALVAAFAILRGSWRRLDRAARPAGAGVAAPPVPMPALDRAASWNGGRRAVIEPGTPVALVIFSATDPRALELLAEAEAWHDAYAARGVRVVGLHRPEFAFAADTTLLAHAIERFEISFPVAHDPALEVALPPGLPGTFVLAGEAGGAGFVANRPGERSEADLWLRARAMSRPLPVPRPPRTRRTEARRLLRLGAGQVAEGPLAGATPGVTATFITQTRGETEGRSWVPVPVGRWTPRGDGIEAARAGAANFLAIRYHAARVGVVVSPPPGARARLWILRDESWVGSGQRGRDLRSDREGATSVEIDEPRLLIPIENDSGWHVLKISPDTPGVVLHALTFEPAGNPGD